MFVSFDLKDTGPPYLDQNTAMSQAIMRLGTKSTPEALLVKAAELKLKCGQSRLPKSEDNSKG